MAQEIDGIWRTVRGRRIFIANGQSLSEAMAKSGKFKSLKDKSENSLMSEHIQKLENLKSSEDGTFDLETGKTKEYQDGYQVTFSMTEMAFSDEEYSKLIDQFKQADHGTVDAGKFGGEAEISFNVTDIKKAGKLAYKYNQISIWDWKNNREIKTGGNGKWSGYKKEDKEDG
jgi:hypothetical protein